jgi:alpha-beta hydrolase superfamily lysophospholipase
MTDTVAGQDFYGEIEQTLTGPGGYVLTTPGTPTDTHQRHYYRFVYDWRQDNAKSAAALDQLVNQIRIDHQKPDLQVDVVAHSMGGLLTRYWLR